MTTSRKILLVEDDPHIARVIADLLRDEGLECEIAADGAAGLQRAMSDEFALVLLDIGLPGIHGLDICRRIKAKRSAAKVIILTAKGDEADVVAGLEVGADDYIHKPFRPREFIARVRTRLREATERAIEAVDHTPALQPDLQPLHDISIGEISIDVNKMRVTKNGEFVALTAREYELVLLLASNPGRPFSRDELLALIWEFETEEYAINVSVFVSRIRRKLEDDSANPKYILTVRSIGYRFVEPSELESGSVVE